MNHPDIRTGNSKRTVFNRFDKIVLVILFSALVIDIGVGNYLETVNSSYEEEENLGNLSTEVGIPLFCLILIIFIIGIVVFLKILYQSQLSNEITNSKPHKNSFSLILVTQIIIIILFASIFFQIILVNFYTSDLLKYIYLVSMCSNIVIISYLASKFYRWFFQVRNSIFLIYALSFSFLAISFIGNLYLDAADFSVAKKDIHQIDSLNMNGYEGEDSIGYFYNAIYEAEIGLINVSLLDIFHLIYVSLFWVSTVMLLRSNTYGSMTTKYALLITVTASLIIAYYLVDATFEPSPSLGAILIFTLKLYMLVLSDLILAIVFISILLKLKSSQPAIRNSLSLIILGIVFFAVASYGGSYYFSYPPLGSVSLAFTGLASYVLYRGLNDTVLYISRDRIIRNALRAYVDREVKFIKNISDTELQIQIQSETININKSLENLYGRKKIQYDPSASEMQEYVIFCKNELKKLTGKTNESIGD